MSFLAPLFLLGTLAVALPILFHLIRRTTRDRVTFSSLMFLLPSPPRVTRRSRLENLLLLALRCLVLCLLALGFARPFLPQPMATRPADTAGGHFLILLDTSASMRRDNLWQEALAKAGSWLDKTGPADQMAISTFDRRVQPLVSFEQWSATPAPERIGMARQRLQTLQPGWAHTDLSQALLASLETLEELNAQFPQSGTRQIVLITDLQKGSRLNGLQGFPWPDAVTVVLESPRAQHPNNATVQILPDQDSLLRTGQANTLKARLRNAEESTQENFQLRWVTTQNQILAEPALAVYVPPSQTRMVSMPLPTNASSLSHLLLSGDDESFDNRAFYVPVQQESRHVLFFGADQATDPHGLLFYLLQAFQETPGQKTIIEARPPTQPASPLPDLHTQFVVVSGNPGEQHLNGIRPFLLQGNSALFILRSPTDTAALSALLETGPLQAQEASVRQYAMLGQIDFSHPLLASFSDPRFSDFSKIHFWKYRRLNTNGLPPAHLVARFDSGDPALLHVPVGQGNLFVLTAGWHPADSQLALSSKFVPLLYSMLESNGKWIDRPNQHVVGDLVTLPTSTGAATRIIRPPDGPDVSLPPGEPFLNTDQPGLYTVTPGSPPLQFAVNLAAEESRTTPLPLAEFERLGPPLQIRSTKTPALPETEQQNLQAAELENRQKLWRWLILLVLAFLLLETWLAGRLSKPTIAQPESASPPIA